MHAPLPRATTRSIANCRVRRPECPVRLKSGAQSGGVKGQSAISHQLCTRRWSEALLCSINPPGEKSTPHGEASTLLAEGVVAFDQCCYGTSQDQERCMINKQLGEGNIDRVLMCGMRCTRRGKFSSALETGGRHPTAHLCVGISGGVGESATHLPADRQPAAWQKQDPFHKNGS